MGIIIGILVGVLALCAILLVFIILIQDDGAEGAGILLGSTASQQYGVRKGNIVTKTTGILATIFMSLSFILAILLTSTDNSDSLQKVADEKDKSNASTVEWWKTSETDTSSTDTTEEVIYEAKDENNDAIDNVISEDAQSEDMQDSIDNNVEDVVDNQTIQTSQE